jgi:hypothetical protein
VAGSYEGTGESLLNAPYVWLTATVLGFLLLNAGLARIAPSPGKGSTALAVAAVVLGAIGTLDWIVLQRERVRRAMPMSRFVVVRWAVATTPFFFAYCAVAAGGEQWAFFVGFVVSMTLLVLSARRTRREHRPADPLAS